MDIQDAVVARHETNLNAEENQSVEPAVVARNEIESERGRKSFLERNIVTVLRSTLLA